MSASFAPDRDRATRGRSIALCAAFACVAIACGREAPPGWELVTIASSELRLADAARGSAKAELRASGDTRSVILADRNEPFGDPTVRAFAVRPEAGGAPIGRLLVGPDAAALHYHLASRDPALPSEAFQPNRLAVVKAADGERLGLLIEGPIPGPRSSTALAELSVETGAARVALAQVLGAWDVVATNRYPVDAEGRPRLPFFVPRAPGDWRVLTQLSPAAFLPAELGQHFVRTPGFRREHYRALARYLQRLPALSAAAESFEAAAVGPDLGDAVGELGALLADVEAAFRGFLDSVWIELVVEAQSPDVARLRLDVYTVSEVTVNAIYVDMPRKLLVVQNETLAGLRLSPETGEDVPARLANDRIEFSLEADVSPLPIGATSFAGTRREFRLTGLAGLEPNFWPLLEGLNVRATNHTTGEGVAADHVARLISRADPRFNGGEEVGLPAFLESLGGVLEAPDREPGQPFFERDEAGGGLRLGPETYTVVQDLILPAGVGLVLDAGVDLRVRAGRSVLVRGPLEVRGTAARPVRVRGAPGEEPWGVLAVQGRGRSALGDPPRPRAAIRHLELSGGSQDFLKGVAYSGQLSVYHADLLLEASHLSHAFADDALNVKYGDVTIRDSSFVDNSADAVDLDWSDGSVRSSFFARGGPGGDGIDVSGSRIRVEGSVFSEFEDKCVSVGEESSLQLTVSLLRNCGIGVASKDSSLATVRQSVLLENGRNFAAYQKKAVFGGGRIHAVDLVVINTAKLDTHDAQSEVIVEEMRDLEGAADAAHAAESLRDRRDFSLESFRALASASR